jgi:hypothetical protein
VWHALMSRRRGSCCTVAGVPPEFASNKRYARREQHGGFPFRNAGDIQKLPRTPGRRLAQ